MASRKTLSALLIAATLLLFSGVSLSQAQYSSTSANRLSLGSIEFPTSVLGEARQEFLTGVLALHSFWYPEARDHFQKARELDPAFAMAYWGEAMTHDHPLWRQHEQSEGKAVLNALNRQENLKWNEREKAYIDAVSILYNSDLSLNERRQQYADAMKKVMELYPGDDEAAAFWALGAMSVSGFSFNSKNDVMPVAKVLEELYERNPEHPGAMHYLIHVYDSNTFAEKGLPPANDYADVAYSSSHAIHMPSHIYKRLGMWDKVIESNTSAWQASVEWQQATGRPLKDRDYHAYSWLFDAYMEIDNFSKACELIQNVRDIEDQAQQNGEDIGRISGTLRDFRNQYEREGGEVAPQCKEES